ncbi:uncharacterized protein METZ01_LOCUS279509, partial [marine metagenome]
MGFACLMAPRINQAVKNSVHKPLLDCRGPSDSLPNHRVLYVRPSASLFGKAEYDS